MIFIYSLFHLYLSRVYLEPTILNDQLPVGLLAQLVERCTGITEVIGFESRTGLIFFQAFFSQMHKLWLELRWSSFCLIHISAVQIYDIYIFIISSLYLSRVYLEPTKWPTPSWLQLLAQLVERCTGIAEAIGFESHTGLIFFRLSFHNCISCVYNCDDLLSI